MLWVLVCQGGGQSEVIVILRSDVEAGGFFEKIWVFFFPIINSDIVG